MIIILVIIFSNAGLGVCLPFSHMGIPVRLQGSPYEQNDHSYNLWTMIILSLRTKKKLTPPQTEETMVVSSAVSSSGLFVASSDYAFESGPAFEGGVLFLVC